MMGIIRETEVVHTMGIIRETEVVHTMGIIRETEVVHTMGIIRETIRKRAADTTKMNTGEKEENRASGA
jgi:hypothetical protein